MSGVVLLVHTGKLQSSACKEMENLGLTVSSAFEVDVLNLSLDLNFHDVGHALGWHFLSCGGGGSGTTVGLFVLLRGSLDFVVATGTASRTGPENKTYLVLNLDKRVLLVALCTLLC